MKPPMHQEIIAYIPRLDDDGNPIKDNHSRPIVDEKSFQARVQYSTATVRGPDGITYQCSLEVDIPEDSQIPIGTNIEYHPNNQPVTKGKVIAINEATNLSGKIVYYRTAYVG